jgi:hypothetical protein
VYPRVVRLAAIETGLPRQDFPPELPYAAEQILGDDLADAGPDPRGMWRLRVMYIWIAVVKA